MYRYVGPTVLAGIHVQVHVCRSYWQVYMYISGRPVWKVKILCIIRDSQGSLLYQGMIIIEGAGSLVCPMSISVYFESERKLDHIARVPLTFKNVLATSHFD